MPINDDFYAESKYIEDEKIIIQFKNAREIQYALYYHDEDNDIFPLIDDNDIPGMNFHDIFYPEKTALNDNLFENPFENKKEGK